MELIIIDSERIKVMLDKQDMEHYHIGLDIARRTLTEYEKEKFLSGVLHDAFEAAGFQIGSDLYIQLFPSVGGGCELFVSRCDKNNTENSAFCTVYRFENLENLLAFSREASLSGTEGELWHYEGDFFLFTEGECLHALEFGAKIKCELSLIVKEHGRFISKEAIRNLRSIQP